MKHIYLATATAGILYFFSVKYIYIYPHIYSVKYIYIYINTIYIFFIVFSKVKEISVVNEEEWKKQINPNICVY